MSKRDRQGGAAVSTDRDRDEDETDAANGQPAAVPASFPAPERKPATPPFQIFKAGQGVTTRWATAAGAGLIALSAANFLYEQLGRFKFVAENLWVRTLAPVALLAGLAYLIFRLIGQHRGTVDFLIATELEMKKVNWSSRREVFGATRVVIVTVLMLGFILFAVDLAFMVFFNLIGVLRVGSVLQGMFGGGAQG
ncbi:MAG: preprotein translocase subunit SecE [Phycisphaerae bacterium]